MPATCLKLKTLKTSVIKITHLCSYSVSHFLTADVWYYEWLRCYRAVFKYISYHRGCDDVQHVLFPNVFIFTFSHFSHCADLDIKQKVGDHSDILGS